MAIIKVRLYEPPVKIVQEDTKPEINDRFLNMDSISYFRKANVTSKNKYVENTIVVYLMCGTCMHLDRESSKNIMSILETSTKFNRNNLVLFKTEE